MGIMIRNEIGVCESSCSGKGPTTCNYKTAIEYKINGMNSELLSDY